MEKTELLEELEADQQELAALLEDLPEEIMLTPGVVGDWSIKDILSHLTFWEGQIVTMLFQIQHGVAKPSTAHFGKESVDEVNKRWHDTGKDRSLEMVWQDWLGVRKQTIRRVAEMDPKDLIDVQRYSWLNGVPLYQWILNDTIEHGEEHAGQISEWLDAHDSAANNNEHH